MTVGANQVQVLPLTTGCAPLAGAARGEPEPSSVRCPVLFLVGLAAGGLSAFELACPAGGA
jgi:hypothetical protein